MVGKRKLQDRTLQSRQKKRLYQVYEGEEMEIEEFIYHAYKDKAIVSADKFKKTVMKDYKVKPSSEVIRRIINYQIKKYGSTLYDSSFINYIDNRHESIKKYNKKRYWRRKKI